MAYKITSQCISCDLCLSVCPTGAIKVVDGNRWIDPNLCTNCVGSIHTVPQCQAGCPTCNGCVKQPSDYWEGWFANYNRSLAKLTNKQDYWERWFNCYSQKFILSNERRIYRNPSTHILHQVGYIQEKLLSIYRFSQCKQSRQGL